MNNLKVSYFGERKGIRAGFIFGLFLLVLAVVFFLMFVVSQYRAYGAPQLEEDWADFWHQLWLAVYGVFLIITLFFIRNNKSVLSIITMSLAFISNIVCIATAHDVSNGKYYQHTSKLPLSAFVFCILASICMAIAVLLICFRYRNLALVLGMLLLSNFSLLFVVIVITPYILRTLWINIPASICLLFLWLPIYLDNICKCGFRNGKDTPFCGGCGKKLNRGFLPFIHSDDKHN